MVSKLGYATLYIAYVQNFSMDGCRLIFFWTQRFALENKSKRRIYTKQVRSFVMEATVGGNFGNSGDFGVSEIPEFQIFRSFIYFGVSDNSEFRKFRSVENPEFRKLRGFR